MRRILATTTLTLCAAVAAGCGDIPHLRLTLRFPDQDTVQATRELLFLARQLPAEGDPCTGLWSQPPSNVSEFPRLLDYPNRTDVVAANLEVGRYTMLTYAYSTDLDGLCTQDSDCVASKIGPKCRPIGVGKKACLTGDSTALAPLAGGCSPGVIEPEQTTELIMNLEKRR